LGKHQGAYLYTIGQRQGLFLSGGPWFVTKIDVENNLVVVANQNQSNLLFSKYLIADKVNWQTNLDTKNILNCQAQVRYRQEPTHCKVLFDNLHLELVRQELQIPTTLLHQKFQFETNQILVIFEQPVKSITKGQSIVFYKDQIMLGGAVIKELKK
jgi:tRNA-uridine 2-sulfurtransferase